MLVYILLRPQVYPDCTNFMLNWETLDKTELQISPNSTSRERVKWFPESSFAYNLLPFFGIGIRFFQVLLSLLC
jgi:hypothetical protein